METVTEPRFEVKKSPIEGKGCFATSAIAKGQVICTFQGKKVTIPELKHLYDSGEERVSDPLQIDDDVYLDVEEPYIFFNHSCDPCAGMKGSGTLFALRDIAPGEEITFDYSSTEWTDDEAWGINWTDIWKIPCRCGASNCRGEVRVFELLPDECKQFYFKEGALMDYIKIKMK
jgi:SET domain-containing protein